MAAIVHTLTLSLSLSLSSPKPYFLQSLKNDLFGTACSLQYSYHYRYFVLDGLQCLITLEVFINGTWQPLHNALVPFYKKKICPTTRQEVNEAPTRWILAWKEHYETKTTED
jgi:hypothetical protein